MIPTTMTTVASSTADQIRILRNAGSPSRVGLAIFSV